MYAPAARAKCLGKRRYSSLIDAKIVADKCTAERPETPLRAYACSLCDGWHLTKKLNGTDGEQHR